MPLENHSKATRKPLESIGEFTEVETRAAIVAEALTWEGTPYMHGAMLKGVGTDCAMLPNAIYSALDLAPRQAISYTQDWMMHRDEEKFLDFVLPHAPRDRRS